MGRNACKACSLKLASVSFAVTARSAIYLCQI